MSRKQEISEKNGKSRYAHFDWFKLDFFEIVNGGRGQFILEINIEKREMVSWKLQ